MADVVTSQQNGACLITLSYRQRTLEASAPDFFEAFCRIRLELEKERLIPSCYGVSLNVYPSGMCRDMGSGMAAYRLTPGQHPEDSDLVGIFDKGPDVVPSSVSAQKDYYSNWLNSWKK